MDISEGRELAPAQLLQSAARAPLAHAQLAWLMHPQELAELFAHEANEQRSYRVAQAHRRDAALPWRERAIEHAGSWWQDWTEWLDPLCGPPVDARPVATPEFPELAKAPGAYVLER